MSSYILYGLAAILAIHLALRYWPRGPLAEFLYWHRSWSAGAKRRGLSPAQMSQEFQFRHAWAELRRRASDAAVANPETYNLKLVEIAAELAQRLALIDRGLAKRFLGVVETSPLSDILYEDAFDAVYRSSTVVPVDIDQDLIAAVKPWR